MRNAEYMLVFLKQPGQCYIGHMDGFIGIGIQLADAMPYELDFADIDGRNNAAIEYARRVNLGQTLIRKTMIADVYVPEDITDLVKKYLAELR